MFRDQYLLDQVTYVGLLIQTRSRRTCHKSTIQASTPSAQEDPLLHAHHRFPPQEVEEATAKFLAVPAHVVGIEAQVHVDQDLPLVTIGKRSGFQAGKKQRFQRDELIA